jgi:hypothetical protein
MNTLKLSRDIISIIKIYLLPCRKQIKCNRKLFLQELYDDTWRIRSDLDSPDIIEKRNIKYENFWCD